MSRAIMGKCPLSPRSGVPTDNEQWVWRYCFYPPHRGVRAEGTASDFAQARVDFEIAWREMQPDITDVEHRRERTLDVMEGPNVDAGCKLATQLLDGPMRGRAKEMGSATSVPLADAREKAAVRGERLPRE
jgi:hypothetical protein